jgi:primary-amine oxidase
MNAAGLYVNQSHGGDGLPLWTSKNRSIMNTDLVLWYTAGFHHVTQTEDWPVLPVHWYEFTLMPYNFFEGNPALNLRSNPQEVAAE